MTDKQPFLCLAPEHKSTLTVTYLAMHALTSEVSTIFVPLPVGVSVRTVPTISNVA